jgi:hypothetical protein
MTNVIPYSLLALVEYKKKETLDTRNGAQIARTESHVTVILSTTQQTDVWKEN